MRPLYHDVTVEVSTCTWPDRITTLRPAVIAETQPDEPRIIEFDDITPAHDDEAMAAHQQAMKHLEQILRLPAALDQIYEDYTTGDGWDIDIMAVIFDHMTSHNLWLRKG